MVIDRQKHIQFLKDEYRAEAEDFKKKFQTKALSLLKEEEEMYVGKFITFRDGEMIMKFPNTRNLPRKGEYLYCMLLPNELQNYRNWGEMTYQDLYGERHKGTETVCIWHFPADDPRFSLVGFRKVDLDFANTMQNLQGNILVFAPQQPPLDYIANLRRIVEDQYSQSVASILDIDFELHEWSPTLIKHDDVTSFVKAQLSLSDKMILQGPPGTGKTYMIADLCARLCNEGKSVLVTALTNRALMEIAEKHFLNEMLSNGKVFKTNMTVDEQKEVKDLQSLKQIAPMHGCLVLSTYYITSGYAAELTGEQPFDIVIMDEASQAMLAMFAASRKMGKVCLWVGDVKQLAPIVSLNEDRIASNGYSPMINGLDLLTASSNNPIYQLTNTYRFGNRAASYTGLFYNNSLTSKSERQRFDIPFAISKILNPSGGPSLILTDMLPSDYAPDFAIKMVAYLVGNILKEDKNKEIAVLTCLIRTTKALQRTITQYIGAKKNILVETIARVQGLTTDTVILVIPYVSYMRSLNPKLFNVVTSRAREHTIIIADKNILNYSSMDLKVRKYLSKLHNEQMVYIPNKKESRALFITDKEDINVFPPTIEDSSKV